MDYLSLYSLKFISSLLKKDAFSGYIILRYLSSLKILSHYIWNSRGCCCEVCLKYLSSVVYLSSRIFKIPLPCGLCNCIVLQHVNRNIYPFYIISLSNWCFYILLNCKLITFLFDELQTCRKVERGVQWRLMNQLSESCHLYFSSLFQRYIHKAVLSKNLDYRLSLSQHAFSKNI